VLRIKKHQRESEVRSCGIGTKRKPVKADRASSVVSEKRPMIGTVPYLEQQLEHHRRRNLFSVSPNYTSERAISSKFSGPVMA
jgi:hypothetical protein